MKISNEKSNIDGLIQDFFNIFTNKEGRIPDWTTLYACCLPETLIIKKCVNAFESYDLDSFMKPRKSLLTDGDLIDFHEWETKEETKIMGEIAQRSSTYNKEGVLNGESFSQSGIKLFQLLKTEQGWKIASVIWQDD